MKPSQVTLSKFMYFVDVYGDAPEAIVSFPPEFYQGDSFIILYKQVMSKVYKTTVPISLENTIFIDNREVSFDEFLTNLINNHMAIEILEPLDVQSFRVIQD